VAAEGGGETGAPPVGDDEVALRAVEERWIGSRGDGSPVLLRGAFIFRPEEPGGEPNFSVHLAGLADREGILAGSGGKWIGFAEARVGDLRAAGFDVLAAPEPGLNSHAKVVFRPDGPLMAAGVSNRGRINASALLLANLFPPPRRGGRGAGGAGAAGR